MPRYVVVSLFDSTRTTNARFKIERHDSDHSRCGPAPCGEERRRERR
jgi:hypothetical protein